MLDVGGAEYFDGVALVQNEDVDVIAEETAAARSDELQANESIEQVAEPVNLESIAGDKTKGRKFLQDSVPANWEQYETELSPFLNDVGDTVNASPDYAVRNHGISTEQVTSKEDGKIEHRETSGENTVPSFRKVESSTDTAEASRYNVQNDESPQPFCETLLWEDGEVSSSAAKLADPLGRMSITASKDYDKRAMSHGKVSDAQASDNTPQSQGKNERASAAVSVYNSTESDVSISGKSGSSQNENRNTTTGIEGASFKNGDSTLTLIQTPSSSSSSFIGGSF